jgi:hypothetical protein
MANPSTDWGSKTFQNVTSLLGSSDTWKKYFPGGIPSYTNAFTPSGTSALPFSPTQVWDWASKTAVAQPVSQTGLTPFTPIGAASPITAEDIAYLQRQNAILSNYTNDQIAAREQGYQKQLMNAALQLRSQDLTNQELVAANDPNNIAKRGGVYQSQMATASNAEANMLDAVQRASYNSMIANATGIATGAKA